ncbi:LacI family DNA-binding transcriptional regulator [Streptomyces rapamycinicus]
MLTTPDSAGAPTVTICDVARVAGVSYQMVSRVINGHGSTAHSRRPERGRFRRRTRRGLPRPPR